MRAQIIDIYIKSLEKPINVINENYIRIGRNTVDSDQNLPAFFKTIITTFGWLPAKPNALEVNNASIILYEPNEIIVNDHKIVDDNNLDDIFQSENLDTNVKVIYDSLKPILTALVFTNYQKNIILLGERGSGKTLIQNTIINVFLPKMIQNGLTYFRSDIVKLHNLNSELGEKGNIENRMDVATFTILHAFYIVLSHADSTPDPILKLFKFNKNVHRPNLDENDSFSKYILSKDETILNFWLTIRESLEVLNINSDNNYNGKNDENLLKFLRVNRLINKDKLIILWEFFLNFSKETNKSDPKQIIIIIDGVDNLLIDEIKFDIRPICGQYSRDWLFSYLRDISIILQNNFIVTNINKLVIALRPDTYKLLRGIINKTLVVDHKGNENNVFDDILNIEIKPPLAYSMALKKLNISDNKKLDRKILLSTLNVTEKGTFNNESQDLNNFNFKHILLKNALTYFIKYHIKNINLCLNITPVKENNFLSEENVKLVLNVAFNGHIRCFSRNLIRTSWRLMNHFETYISKNDDNFTNPKKIELFENINDTQVIFDQSVLAGQSLFKQNIDEGSIGRWCPNLFDFEPLTGINIATTRWLGLVMLRVLELLPDKDNPKEQNNRQFSTLDLVEILEYMHYPQVAVSNAIHIASNFGLIKLEDIIFKRETKVWDRTWSKTRKGSFIQNLPFKQPTTMYLMATGTPMTRLPLKSDSLKYMQEIHWLHKENFPRNFYPAVIRTGSLLYRHIRDAIKYDSDTFETSLAKLKLENPEKALSLDLLKDKFSFNSEILELSLEFFVKVINEKLNDTQLLSLGNELESKLN
jgi:hypothetical protein